MIVILVLVNLYLELKLLEASGYIQWNLSTTDKLGIGPLSLVERLSPSRSLSLYHYCITK